MSDALSTIPLCSMGGKCLQAYITNQLMDWPVKLGKKERDSLFASMWNSVVSMKLKCMSQEERYKFYRENKKKAEVKQDVDQQIRNRRNRLKTHHVYV